MKTEMIEPTEAEILGLHQEILRRNDVRRRAQLPRLDVEAALDQEINRLRDRKFEKALQPYLVAALHDTPGHPGLPTRLKQTLKSRRRAISALENDLGVRVNQRAASVSLLSFILSGRQRDQGPS